VFDIFRRQGHLLNEEVQSKAAFDPVVRAPGHLRLHLSQLDEEPRRAHDMFDGRPVIGICNTWSELTPCNTHFRVLADHVRHGVLDAGGFPLRVPGHVARRDADASYRDALPQSRQHGRRGVDPRQSASTAWSFSPACDKTTPATLMGACSVDLPTILVSGGTDALRQVYHGNNIGSGTNTWSMSEELRAGKLTLEEFHEAESCMHRSHGHCMTMGTRVDDGVDDRGARRRHAWQRGEFPRWTHADMTLRVWPAGGSSSW